MLWFTKKDRVFAERLATLETEVRSLKKTDTQLQNELRANQNSTTEAILMVELLALDVVSEDAPDGLEFARTPAVPERIVPAQTSKFFLRKK